MNTTTERRNIKKFESRSREWKEKRDRTNIFFYLYDPNNDPIKSHRSCTKHRTVKTLIVQLMEVWEDLGTHTSTQKV